LDKEAFIAAYDTRRYNTSTMTFRHPLARRIAAFIALPPDLAAEDQFNRLALELYAYQYERNIWMKRLGDAAQRPPDALQSWRGIPAMPTDGFKDFDLSCIAPGRASAVFYSSGTTGRQSSRHYLGRDALLLYEASLRRGFASALPQRPAKLWALMPPPSDAPHSSLSHMLGALGAERFFWDDDRGLAEALSGLREPITLFGTAFALAHLLDSTHQTWRLPPGSVLLETGGFKGRTREVPRDEFYGLLHDRLGVPLQSIWSEYGMSEMASQFYGQGLNTLKRGPHWVRTLSIHPGDGAAAPPGQPGALRHLDLANFNSALCLQTADWGTQTPDGFLLHGRAPGADIRGCSLSVEEVWNR